MLLQHLHLISLCSLTHILHLLHVAYSIFNLDKSLCLSCLFALVLLRLLVRHLIEALSQFLDVMLASDSILAMLKLCFMIIMLSQTEAAY